MRRFAILAGGDLAGWSRSLRSGGGRVDGRGGASGPNNRGGGHKGFFARLRRNARAGRGGGRGDEEWAGEGGATDHVDDSDRNEKDDDADPPPSAAIHHNPWILPPHLRLAPRADAWLALACSSCASVASVGRIHAESSSRYANADFGPGDKFALSTCAISFILSFGAAMGMRYAPARDAFTRRLFAPTIVSPRDDGTNARRRQRFPSSWNNITIELLLLVLLSIFWIASMPIIVDGNAYYNSDRDGGVGIPLAVAGPEIWNANLFYSSWLSFLLSGYLFVEVYTLHDRRGTLPMAVDRASSASSSSTTNAFSKRWTLLGCASILIMSASVAARTSPACHGTILRSTRYCRRALAGALVGGLLQLLVVLAVGTLHALKKMDPRAINSRIGSRLRTSGSRVVSPRAVDVGCAVANVASLAVQSVNAAILTSSGGGGPGNASGTLYFGSWLGFALAFEMGLRRLERWGEARGAARRGSEQYRAAARDRRVADRRSCNVSMGGASHTTYSSSDEAADRDNNVAALMLETGNNNSNNGRRGGSRTGANSTNLVAVEDVNSDDDDEIDGLLRRKSFVFGTTGSVGQKSSSGRSGRRKKKHSRRSESPGRDASALPNIATNQHFGGGRDPDEDSSTKLGSLRNSDDGDGRRRSGSSPSDPGSRTSSLRKMSSGSDPVGSIDVRSAQRSTGSSRNNAPSSRNDPDGNVALDIDRKWSGHYNDSRGDETRAEDLGDSAFFDETFDRHANGGGDDVIDDDDRYNGRGGRSSRAAPAARANDPGGVRASMVLTSFQMDRVEKLDDHPQQQRRDSNNLEGAYNPPTTQQTSRHPSSHLSNLSPLEEGSGEVTSSPNDGEVTDSGGRSGSGSGSNPLTVDGSQGSSQATEVLPPNSGNMRGSNKGRVGDNLRTMQAVRGVMHHVQQQQQQQQKQHRRPTDQSKSTNRTTGSSKKSNGASTRSSRSRSKDKGLSGIKGAGGVGGQVSRHSRQSTTASRRTMPSVSTMSRSHGVESVVLTDHDEQGGSSGKHSSSQRGKFKYGSHASGAPSSLAPSASTMSSRAGGSAILTEDEGDESGSNPPPTISDADGLSTKDGLSEFSQITDRSKGNNAGVGGGNVAGGAGGEPPPPPFRRPQLVQPREPDYDAASLYSNSAPMRSINTGKGSGGSSDTIVSDPTLDAGLESPSRSGGKSSKSSGSGSASTVSTYNKKFSDETEIPPSSDENPSSREAEGGKHGMVDNIVAAALAYAERTHSESDFKSAARPPKPMRSSSSSNANNSNATRQNRGQGQQPNKYLQRASTTNTAGDESSSIHSFYTEDDKGSGKGGGTKRSHPQYMGPGGAAQVEHLVAKALIHAQGQMEGGSDSAGPPPTPQQQQQQQQGVPPMAMQKSEYSSQFWSREGQSAGSMYSEDDDTDFSGQGTSMHFDC